MATEENKNMEDYMRMYPNLSPERIQTLIEIGATKQQWEASNNNEKRNIDNALSRRQLGPFTNEAEKAGQQKVVVMGATGAGKSATANTLIGKKRFREGSSAVSVTTDFEKESTQVDGLQLTVVDTPESWKTPTTSLMLPDHIFYLMVINLASPRFGQQELKAVRALRDEKGWRILPFGLCFLVLTHADSTLQNISLDGYLSEIEGDPLHEFITKDLRGNVLAVNNSAETVYEQQRQREDILNGVATAKAQSFEIGWFMVFVECIEMIFCCPLQFVCVVFPLITDLVWSCICLVIACVKLVVELVWSCICLVIREIPDHATFRKKGVNTGLVRQTWDLVWSCICRVIACVKLVVELVWSCICLVIAFVKQVVEPVWGHICPAITNVKKVVVSVLDCIGHVITGVKDVVTAVGIYIVVQVWGYICLVMTCVKYVVTVVFIYVLVPVWGYICLVMTCVKDVVTAVFFYFMDLVRPGLKQKEECP